MSGLILSCEHASARVPDEFRAAFSSPEGQKVLSTHRAFDAGALVLARGVKKDVEAMTRSSVPLAAGGMTRLLVDLNRSSHHRQVHSEFAESLAPHLITRLKSYQQEYHDALRALIVRTQGQVLHVAVHSFTPVWDGEERTTDVGVLFDPARKPELTFARRCQAHLQEATGLRIHRNAPYRGISDGLPTLLRREFSPRKYVGVELEVNQRILMARGRKMAQRDVRRALVQVLGAWLETA